MGTNLEKEKKKMSEQRYRKMEGKWLQTKADNVEKFMETQGMSWAKRKIATKLTPTIIFSFPNDDTLKIEFTTTVMSRVQEYKINGVTKHKGNLKIFAGDFVTEKVYLEILGKQIQLYTI